MNARTRVPESYLHNGKHARLATTMPGPLRCLYIFGRNGFALKG